MRRKKRMNLRRVCVVAVAALPLLYGQADWPNPGNDPGGMKYSTLKQITPANVNKLVRAWTYDTGDVGGGFRGWQVTPLVVDGVMYFSTMGGKIVALNADTGAEIWKFDGKTGSPSGRFAQRGISFWQGDPQSPAAVLPATADGFLIQIDAKTAKLAHRFDKDW